MLAHNSHFLSVRMTTSDVLLPEVKELILLCHLVQEIWTYSLRRGNFLSCF